LWLLESAPSSSSETFQPIVLPLPAADRIAMKIHMLKTGDEQPLRELRPASSVQWPFLSSSPQPGKMKKKSTETQMQKRRDHPTRRAHSQ
jgi:hypothetical protein